MKTWNWKKRAQMVVVSMLVIFNLVSFSGLETSVASAANNQKVSEGDGKRVIVTFKNKADKSHFKGKTSRGYKHFSKAMSVTLTAKEIEQLKKDPDIQSIEPDILLTSTAQSIDWGVSVVQATYAWDRGVTGKGVKVAILDTGIDTHHEDLTVAGGASFVPYTTSFDDDNGHGTHVAGIIGAKNNDLGVAGVAPDASLYSVKVLDATGKGYVSEVIAGIDWAVDNKMDIVNMSMATSVDSPALHAAVDKAYESGLLVVASAGNVAADGGISGNVQYPAKYSSVIAVGAVDQHNQRAAFSATGSELEVVAPGVGIQSTYLGNGYSAKSGTSMAAPFVVGKLALLKEENSKSSNSELRQMLDSQTLDLGEEGRDLLFGHGSLNMQASTGDQGSVTDPSIIDAVYKDNALLNATALTGPKVLRQVIGSIVDDTNLYPNLSNAKSITHRMLENGSGGHYYVLTNDNKVLARYNAYNSSPNTVEYDVTAEFPSLTNAKAIMIGNDSGTGGILGGYYVLNEDNTVKNRLGVDYSSLFPDLTNSKSIAVYSYTTYVLYNDNTIKARNYWTGQINNYTTGFPDLTNAKSIAVNIYPAANYQSQICFSVAYLDRDPTITVTSNNQTAYKNTATNTVTLTGTTQDPDNDPVTISATIGGKTKSVTLSNTVNSQPWTLQWNVDTDIIPVGSYSKISVTANDSLWGTKSAIFNGVIAVDQLPNVPSGLNPGHTNSATPTMVNSQTSALKWTFSDPDAGDTQSAYQVLIYNSAGTTKIHDSGWVTSSVSSFTVPSNLLSRGSIYKWQVRVKDSKAGISSLSPFYFVQINRLPTAGITSYVDGQTINDNVLNLTWNYSDSDAHLQDKYQVIGSKDGWATWGYNSGEITSASTTHVTTPLSSGIWSFAVRVRDGYEWSSWVYRNNLSLPSEYEPNDTTAQAYLIKYNQNIVSNINSATDIDFFKYKATINGIDRLKLTVPTGQNYDVFIYDSGMNLIAAGVNQAGLPENVLYDVTAGATYYVKIIGVNGSYHATSYTLNVSNLTMKYQTTYQYDSNGNIITKTTTKIE